MARIDYNRAAATYDQGRAHPLHVFDEWRQRLAEHLPTGAEGPILDVGAGTGIWASAFDEWFGLPVVALEPAAGMRAEAHGKGLPPRVRFVAGDGQAIPLRDATCRAAWLSTVIHHISDLGACATELRRVLRAGAPVLIRSSFPGRHDEIPLFRFFPGAGRVAQSFPTVDQTVAEFSAAGFRTGTAPTSPRAAGGHPHRLGDASPGYAPRRLNTGAAQRRRVRFRPVHLGDGGRLR